MLKGLKYRICPTKEQQVKIQRAFGCVRYVYNQGLAFRQEQYQNGNPIGYNETNRLLNKLKHDGEHDWLNDTEFCPLQQGLRDLDQAFKNFFNKTAGYPKFRSKHDNCKSYRTQQQKGNIRVIDKKHIRLPKLGDVKIRLSRPVNGVIRNATVEQHPNGHYFVVLTVECEDEICLNGYGMTGIDVGIKDFLIESNGHKVSNPQFFRKTEKKLKHAQRRLSHMIKGSNNWNKQRIKVAKLYERLVNQKDDFLHKESTRLVKENQIICHEDLNVRRMLKNHHLAKAVSEASWYKFFTMLDYKAHKYGCEIITVPRFYASSQICSDCGFQYEGTKDLSVRKWICPKCGSKHDRDVNAAVNILHKGLEIRQQQLNL